MRPLFFDGRFGWLHPAGSTAPVRRDGRRLGVVICAAFAQEEVCTHHGLMLLAERLATEGMPTLRFDYGGTGDSIDVPVTLDGLVDDVARAARCLRHETDVDAVALVGLRLGGAVAVRAAPLIEGVAALALLAPVTDGRAFLRETRAAASVSPLAELDPVPRPDLDTPLNTNGFLWSPDLQRQIAGLVLDENVSPAPHILLAAVRADRRTTAYASALRKQGVAVLQHPFAGYEAFMQDPTVHVVPEPTFAAVASWLADPNAVPMPVVPDLTTSPAITETMLTADGFEETPCRFGPENRVFGMLCRPAAIATSDVAALLLHEGSTHHIGNGRAYVALARRLARAGIASLRMDLSGMGDSLAAAGGRSPFFDPLRHDDALAGVEQLAMAGYGRVVAMGLCSGAHLALQIGLADERVVGLHLTNLPRFVWRYGDDVRLVRRDSKRSMRSYLRSTRSPAAWRRTLLGGGDLLGIARVLSRRLIESGIRSVRDMRPPKPGSERAIVRDQMRRLAERQVDTLMILTDEDTGLAEMAAHFGRAARRLKAFAPARMIVLPRADHHFNARDARRRHGDLIEAAMIALTRV